MRASSASNGGKAGYSISERASATKATRRRYAGSLCLCCDCCAPRKVCCAAHARRQLQRRRQGWRRGPRSWQCLLCRAPPSAAAARGRAGGAPLPQRRAGQRRGRGRRGASGRGRRGGARRRRQRQRLRGGGCRGGAGGAAAVPARLQRPPGARAIKALSTDPHVLSPQRKCPYGCGALVWPEEGTVCCSAGKRILGAEYNQLIDDSYLQILTMEHVSKDSRHLYAGLAMGTQGIFPSKAVGGLGWHEQGGWSHLSQEYALVQHSRQVENTLNFQRFGGLQAKLKRRREVNPREGQQGAGSRVALTAYVVGSF